MNILEQPGSRHQEASEGLSEQHLREQQGKKATIATWFEARTGLISSSRAFLHWEVPKYVERNLLYSLGGLTLISLLYQMFTGLCLTFYYDPSAEGAYNSVDFITYQAPLGWLVRSMHHYNASVVVVLVFLHLLRTFFSASYKRPREVT